MTDDRHPPAGTFLGMFFYPFSSLGGVGFLLSGSAALTLTHSLRTGLRRDPTLFLLTLSVLQMRALGLAYRKHQEHLGWSLGADA